MSKQITITGLAVAMILLLGALVSSASAVELGRRQTRSKTRSIDQTRLAAKKTQRLLHKMSPVRSQLAGARRQDLEDYFDELNGVLVRERMANKTFNRGSDQYKKGEKDAAKSSSRQAADLYQGAADQLAEISAPSMARRLHKLKLRSLRDAAAGAKMVSEGIGQNDQNMIDEGLRLYRSTVPKDKQAKREAARLDKEMAK